MGNLKRSITNFFLHTTKGKEAFSQTSSLAKLGHFGEAAGLARKVLNENSAKTQKISEITSYEKKLLSGCYLSNKDKAEELGQKIPVLSFKA